MAWEKNFTDGYGDNYPNSYWRVAQCNLNKEGQSGLVVFNCYISKDKAGGRLLAQRPYNITPEVYQEFFSPALIQPAGIDHIKQCYAMSLAVKDVDTGEKDDHGNPVCKSFFEESDDK